MYKYVSSLETSVITNVNNFVSYYDSVTHTIHVTHIPTILNRLHTGIEYLPFYLMLISINPNPSLQAAFPEAIYRTRVYDMKRIEDVRLSHVFLTLLFETQIQGSMSPHELGEFGVLLLQIFVV